MRKLVLATASLLAMTVAGAAATINITASEDGGQVFTFSSPNATATLGPAATPSGDFVVTVTGSTQGQGGLLPPFLVQGQTLDIQQLATGSHTLDIGVVGVGLTSPSGLSALLSGFDATGLSAGWTATISTDINGAIIDTSTFTGPVSGGHDAQFASFNLPGMYNASVDFHIATNGIGAANLGGALSATPVPGPVVGAGLPGLLAAFGSAGLWWRKRRRA
jgi:hypothetical protein